MWTLLDLAGTVALLLWGLHMVQTGIQRGYGPDLRRWLGTTLGNRLAAQLYGCVVLRAGVEEVEENKTRFVWLARSGAAPGGPRVLSSGAPPLGPWKTAVVFWGVGSEAPGWLVACLSEFAERGVNLTRIESRPRKQGLGRYMFFVDMEGHEEDAAVVAALGGLRGHVERLKVLGSYPAA